MGKPWTSGHFAMQRRDDLTYQIFFANSDIVMFVLNNGPWHYDNSLVLVRLPSIISPYISHGFEKEYLWVLLTSLPRYCYTLDVGVKMARKMDSCKLLQIREDQVAGTKYFRFRALIEINKPLNRVMRIELPDGSSHLGLLKYVRLTNLCFLCGHLGHRYRKCELMGEGALDVKQLPYRSWMGGVDHLPSYLISEWDDAISDEESPTDGESSGLAKDNDDSINPQKEIIEEASENRLIVLDHNSDLSLTPKKRQKVEKLDETLLDSSILVSKRMKSQTAVVAWQPCRHP